MKKFVKLFSLIALLFVAVFALSSCGAKQSKEENKYEVKIQSIVSSDAINLIKKAEWIAAGNKAEDFKEVNYLGLFDSTNGIFYLDDQFNLASNMTDGTEVLERKGDYQLDNSLQFSKQFIDIEEFAKDPRLNVSSIFASRDGKINGEVVVNPGHSFVYYSIYFIR